MCVPGVGGRFNSGIPQTLGEGRKFGLIGTG